MQAKDIEYRIKNPCVYCYAYLLVRVGDKKE